MLGQAPRWPYMFVYLLAVFLPVLRVPHSDLPSLAMTSPAVSLAIDGAQAANPFANTAAFLVSSISSSKCSRVRSTRGSRNSAMYFREFSSPTSQPDKHRRI